MVAIFQYMSDINLYRLMVTDGTVEVLRDGALMTIDQTDVVPGDIIRLSVSDCQQLDHVCSLHRY